MNVDIAGSISPIYLIGDSHCLQFKEILFNTRQPQLRYRCAVSFFVKLTASDYLVDGAINPMLLAALKAEGVFNDAGEPDWLVPDASSTYLSGRPALSPTMVFFAGEANIQNLIAELGDEFDFELPDDPGYSVDFDKSPAPFSFIQERIESQLAPFVEVMARLRQSFPGLMIHALPPRDRDDDRSSHWSFKIKVAAPVRAKVALAANRHLAEVCGRLNIPFVDPWDDLSVDGFMRPEFGLDGMHINRSAAPIMLDRIMDAMLDNIRASANPTRHSVLRGHSPSYAGPFHPASLSWSQDGYLLDKLLVSEVVALNCESQFQSAETNARVSPEWIGYPRAGRPGVALAEPSLEILSRAAKLFGSGHPRSILQVGESKDLTIVNFRPVEIPAGASVTASTIPSPPDCRRALLFVGESSSIVIADASGHVLVQKSVRAGAIAVWDPKRIAIFARARAEPIRVVEMMLMPRYPLHPFRVAWAGLNDWPADPFHYTVRDIVAYPPFETDLVRERA